MNIATSNPNAIVTFYTETGNLVARTTGDPSSRMDDDVVNVTTTRDMGADAPTFSIDLTRRRAWDKWVAPNDLISISMTRPPEAVATVFVGLVDDVRRRTIVNGNSVERVISVSGRGVSKAFIQFDIGIVPEAEVVSDLTGYLIAAGVKIQGSTLDIILKSIWDMVCKKYINYKWSNGKSLFDSIGHKFVNKQNFVFLGESNIVNWQGSLWALFKEIAESPFYELFWEIEGGKPVLNARPTPFSQSSWQSLPSVSITDADVVIDEVGKSDLETYTIYSVGAKTLYTSNDPYSTFATLPLWNANYANKYGLRRLHVYSGYVAVADKIDEVPATEIMTALKTDLYNWNIKNNAMLNGNILVKGSTKYKIGNRLVYASKEDNSTIEYYIKSVTHNFVNYTNWVTKLEVTRGINPNQRFADPYGKATECKGIGLAEYNPAMAKKRFEEGKLKLLTSANGDRDVYGGDIDSASYKDLVDRVIQGAKMIMNSNRIKYIYGANDYTKGRFDCSAFVSYVFRTYGNIEIGRTTYEQIKFGVPLSTMLLLKPGDIVLFRKDPGNSMVPSHVGLFIGDGKFIHCSSGSGGVAITELTQPYYHPRFIMGRRVLSTLGGPTDGKPLPPTDAQGIAINKVVTNGLKNTGAIYVSACREYKIDPVLAAAISMHETGNGTSKGIKEKNNVGGMMVNGGKVQMTFGSIREGIYAHVRNLSRLYCNETYKLYTIDAISRKYAPIGADNDPNNLNQHWVSGVSKYYDRIKGAM